MYVWQHAMRVHAHTRQMSSSYLLLSSLPAPSSMEADFAAVWLREGGVEQL